jgi:hypothetical protein
VRHRHSQTLFKGSAWLGYVPESHREGRGLWGFKGFLMTMYVYLYTGIIYIKEKEKLY